VPAQSFGVLIRVWFTYIVLIARDECVRVEHLRL
jgi:hypothetical protein